jgi:DNA-binding protein HU-beta
VNKNQLIDVLAARFNGNKRAARHALESVLDTVTREVAKGEKVAITGFGSFEKRVRSARMVRNPRTGERIKAKATSVPKFTAGQDLKNVVSGAKKLPKMIEEIAVPTARVAAAAAPAKKTTTKKAAKKTVKKAAAKKATAKKAVKKAVKKAAKKAPAKKAPAKKAPAKKSPAKKAAKKAPAKKAPAKKVAKKAAKKAPAKKAPAKKAAKRAPARKAAKKR